LYICSLNPTGLTRDALADKPHGGDIRHDARIPLGRFGLPSEVANAVMFLALNNYAHNCELNLDGGLSAAAFPNNPPNPAASMPDGVGFTPKR
jgi:NAD(P)-dependent dehydrogenase (short-subunit alcohol dehydrogenase family)